jgi:hypothetical protein
VSFAERNKAWLLPVLAVGVAAVLWFDLRSAPAAPVQEAPSTAGETVPAAAPAPSMATAPATDGQPPPPSPAVALPALTPESWGDLRAMNTVPDFLNQSVELTAQATRPLSAEQLSPPARTAAGGQALPSPATLNLDVDSGSGNIAPPPLLDFISRTPEGVRAWYEGTGFRVGQTILGTAYRIREIHPPRVVLEGPAGRVEQTTFVLERPEAGSPRPETP